MLKILAMSELSVKFYLLKNIFLVDSADLPQNKLSIVLMFFSYFVYSIQINFCDMHIYFSLERRSACWCVVNYVDCLRGYVDKVRDELLNTDNL